MRCKIREKRVDCGDYTYVDLYPVYSEAPVQGRKRKAKYKETPETMQKLNDRNSKIKQEQIIHANFDNTSYKLEFTYNNQFLPIAPKRAKMDIQNLIRVFQRMYKKAGVELRYMYVTQYGEKSGRVHHHMIMTGGVSREQLIKAWGMGRMNIDELQFIETGVADLSAYIGRDDEKQKKKELPELWKKRWCGSKNLKKPVEKLIRDNVIRQKDVKFIQSNYYEKGLVTAECKKTIEDRYEGYSLSEVEVCNNEINKGVYIHLKLYRTDSPLLAWLKPALKKKRKV